MPPQISAQPALSLAPGQGPSGTAYAGHCSDSGREQGSVHGGEEGPRKIAVTMNTVYQQKQVDQEVCDERSSRV